MLIDLGCWGSTCALWPRSGAPTCWSTWARCCRSSGDALGRGDGATSAADRPGQACQLPPEAPQPGRAPGGFPQPRADSATS
ncbi:hypothetical protein HBB16_01080 [Pseudonocardia sp. MCCB 268]|nr:hypothetical protein [Pseudonocardia cytotoxica]